MEFMWVTFIVKFASPNQYSYISVHSDELSALRYANAVGGRVVRLPLGTNLNTHLQSTNFLR